MFFLSKFSRSPPSRLGPKVKEVYCHLLVGYIGLYCILDSSMVFFLWCNKPSRTYAISFLLRFLDNTQLETYAVGRNFQNE